MNRVFSSEVVESIVRNMFIMEYVGPDMKGFDPAGMPYTKFLNSIKGRKDVEIIG